MITICGNGTTLMCPVILSHIFCHYMFIWSYVHTILTPEVFNNNWSILIYPISSQQIPKSIRYVWDGWVGGGDEWYGSKQWEFPEVQPYVCFYRGRHCFTWTNCQCVHLRLHLPQLAAFPAYPVDHCSPQAEKHHIL